MFLQNAIKSLVDNMKEATLGNGIDRHMLGLRCMLLPGEETDIFDADYWKSQHYSLSTSNMSPGKLFYGGFGPVYPDGYGINYAIDEYELKFSISAKSNNQLNHYKMREEIERCLKDMRILFPKPSSVWGYNWVKDQELDRRNHARLARLYKLSEKVSENQLVQLKKLF